MASYATDWMSAAVRDQSSGLLRGWSRDHQLLVVLEKSPVVVYFRDASEHVLTVVVGVCCNEEDETTLTPLLPVPVAIYMLLTKIDVEP